MENAYKVSINPVKGQAVTQMLHAITFSQMPPVVGGNRKASIWSPALVSVSAASTTSVGQRHVTGLLSACRGSCSQTGLLLIR